MSQPKFRHNIQIFVPICFLLLLAAIITVVVYTTHTIIKPVLLKERMYGIGETGKSVVTKINSMLGQTEIAASVVGSTATSLLPNFEAIKKTVPSIFNMDSLEQVIAGGGIWPEPFKFDPSKEKFSFFWGRDSHGNLRFYNDYNISGYHREEWYIPVKYLKGNKVFWSRAYIDPFSHEPMVTCSIRMDRNGQFIGVATVDLRLSGLNRLFSGTAEEIKGYVFALDRNNRFIIFPREYYGLIEKKDKKGLLARRYITSEDLAHRYPEFKPISKRLEKLNQTIIKKAREKGNIEQLAQKLLKESDQISPREALLIAAYLNESKESRLTGATHVERFSVDNDIIFHEPAMVSIFLMPETNWKLIVTVPKSVAVAPVSQVTNSIVVSLAVLITLVLFFAGLSLYLHILRPLRQITNQLKKIEKDSGDLSLELDIPANNELGELAYYFNLRTRELRNSEERYRTIFNRASEGISLSSIKGNFIAVNPRFAEIFGYESPEEVIEKVRTYNLYVNLADRKKVLAGIKAGKGTVHQEVWFKKKDGSHILVALNLAPITDPEGNVKYLIAMTQDITRTKELEAELRHAQKMEAIGTLAGGIAHDFNNILAAITGYTELAMIKVKDTHQVRKYLSQIGLAAQRAKELVRQILTFSRYTDARKEPQDLAKIIKEVLKLLRSTLPANITIETRIRPTGPVLADPSDLHQIVMNLCTNAYHAMREDGGVLTISLNEKELNDNMAQELGLQPGSYAVLQVKDTGCGMDQQTMGKIFEPYFTTKSQDEGTGLGLAVVHGIVKGLKGCIRVESTLGKGTIFKVFLPVLKEKTPSNHKHVSHLSRVTKVNGKGKRVMFVDDEEMICSIFKASLEEMGFRVDVFRNGQDALEMLEKAPERWDLLITDMTMPGMSGSDLIKKVRILNPTLSIILCSGYSDVLTEEFIKDLGINAFLSKPVERLVLLKTLAKIFPD